MPRNIQLLVDIVTETGYCYKLFLCKKQTIWQTNVKPIGLFSSVFSNIVTNININHKLYKSVKREYHLRKVTDTAFFLDCLTLKMKAQ